MSAQVVLDNWGQQDREGRNIDVGFQNHKNNSPIALGRERTSKNE